MRSQTAICAPKPVSQPFHIFGCAQGFGGAGMRIITSVICGLLFAPRLFCDEASAQSTAVQVQPQPALQSLGTRTVRDENQVKLKRNAWTVGLAAGLPEGAPLRFAVELARVLDDGDNMRVIPM